MSLVALRFFDIILSILGLVFAAPVMVLICLLGLFETGQPIFYQKRLGRNKVPFTLIKFRTMPLLTPSLATHLVKPNAVSPLGRLLRRTKLDELPQLLNVVMGQMSIVGPRPGLPDHFALVGARERLGVFDVRPGITGLSQVSGIDMSKPKLLAETDALMISEMSISSYFRYIFLTVLGHGRGDRIQF
jgi:O-antigen biosynthesis protein WbqP